MTYEDLGGDQAGSRTKDATATEASPTRNMTYEDLGGDQAGSRIGEALSADYQEAHQDLNPGIAIWCWRTCFDALTLGVDRSLQKHRDEWRIALGLPPRPRPKPPADLFAGDFCGIRLPGVPFHPTGLVFTPALGCYDVGWQGRIVDEYVTRGYTRMPLNVGGAKPYHDVYPALPDGYGLQHQYDDLLARLISRNVTPIIFVLDDTRGPDPSYTFGMLDEYGASGAEFAVGWEMNGWLTPAEMYTCVEAISRRLGQKVWVHFTPNHAAIDEPEADSWRRIQPFVHGILFQGDNRASPADVGARLADFTRRLQTGYHGWPFPLKVIAFELSAYNKFHDGWTEQQGIDFTRQVIGHCTPPPDGFCDGGSP